MLLWEGAQSSTDDGLLSGPQASPSCGVLSLGVLAFSPSQLQLLQRFLAEDRTYDLRIIRPTSYR